MQEPGIRSLKIRCNQKHEASSVESEIAAFFFEILSTNDTKSKHEKV